jgi:hypothetical protein
MKLGAEKKGEVIALALLLGVAGVLLWRNLAPGGAPAAAPATAAVSAPAGNAAAVSPAQWAHLDPRLHLEVLAALRDHTYSGNGRDLFHLGPAPPPLPSPAAIAARQRAEAAQQQMARRNQAPPPPPPIPLTFYGFAQAQGQSEKIFLQLGDDTYVVVTGDVVAHRYQIEAIGKQSVRVKDLMTQSVQEVPLQRPAQ